MKEWTADDEYIRGKRDIMLEMAKEDLIDVASRIAILESDLDGARKTKLELVQKIQLLEAGVDLESILEDDEPLTLHEKIDLIKKGFAT
ncbi:MAG TPA: hypothetical protein DF712_01750 [Balneola sp.]|nr:hypothetical protein [Balneola sp.]